MEKERIKLYQEFIGVILDSMRLGKQSVAKPKLVKQLGAKIQSIGLHMMVISSDKVVNGYLLWRATAMGEGNAEAVFKTFADLIVEMRRELIGLDGKTAGDVLDILT